MAVGQTLRSPMRGARSLAERLRSRGTTGAIWVGFVSIGLRSPNFGGLAWLKG